MNPITFLFTLIIGIFSTFAYSIITTQLKYTSSKHSAIIFVTISIIAIVIANITSDFNSHGFDIPAWAFGFIFFILCLNAYFFAKVSVWFVKNYMGKVK